MDIYKNNQITFKKKISYKGNEEIKGIVQIRITSKLDRLKDEQFLAISWRPL